ncbi:MAG: glycosyltransferase family 2 protein [Phycisphaerae bacterium]|nr:glycosyltransferase family 2 protein [Phycisphaerae bacterium]
MNPSFQAADELASLSIMVIIPALNEQECIEKVVGAVPQWVRRIIVVDNGSTDDTPGRAAAAGAQVVREPRRGYGRACLTGCAAATDADIIVFLDGDLSDYPERMEQLVRPIAEDHADFVIGSRTRGAREAGALLPQQRFGGWLACVLIRLFWGYRYTDLGPFRAIRIASLNRLRMDDQNFGWTVQMQVRAVVAGLRIMEIPVDYRRRIGKSKISGTLRGVLGAGSKILYSIGREVCVARHRVRLGHPSPESWRAGLLDDVRRIAIPASLIGPARVVEVDAKYRPLPRWPDRQAFGVRNL